MEAIVFVGIQATGKSTFFRERFFRTHVRINLDMLKTRRRELLLLQACLDGQQPFVIDNTNPAREDRSRYLPLARAAGFRTVGYYFRSTLAEALPRNAARSPCERIPDVGVRGTAARLELPSLDEGFDQLFYVRIAADAGFDLQEFRP